MNERIRQLAEQAGSTHKQNLGVYQFYTDELEKFAELIVRECCLVLEQTQTALDRHKWPTPSECGIYIKQHFGVEE